MQTASGSDDEIHAGSDNESDANSASSAPESATSGNCSSAVVADTEATVEEVVPGHQPPETIAAATTPPIAGALQQPGFVLVLSARQLSFIVFGLILFSSLLSETLLTILEDDVDENAPESIHTTDLLYKFSGRVSIGHTAFHLVNAPSDLTVVLTPIDGDVDLYIATAQETVQLASHSRELSQLLVETKTAILAGQKPPAAMPLSQTLPWDLMYTPDKLDHPFNNAAKNDGGSTSWSDPPPFAFSSCTLGVEAINISPTTRIGRPLLVAVHASAASVFAPECKYNLTLRRSQPIIDSYETVRRAADRGSPSYDELVELYGTVPMERNPSKKREASMSSSTPASTTDGDRVLGFRVIEHIVFGLLDTILNIAF